MSFGDLVKIKRIVARITLQQLAKETGIDTGTMSRIENERADATIISAMRLCRSLHISFDELVDAAFKNQTSLDEQAEEQLRQERDALSNGVGQHNLLKPLSVATSIDVRECVIDFAENRKRGQQLFAKWLAAIAQDIAKNHPSLSQPTGLLDGRDMERLLAESSLYRFELKYPPFQAVDTIVDLYQAGSALLMADVQAYARLILSTEARQLQLGRQLESVLDRLETGNIERLLLRDVVALDQELKDRGLFLGMFWQAYMFGYSVLGQLIDAFLMNLPLPNTDWEKLRLLTFTVFIFRWFHYLEGLHKPWLQRLQSDLRHAQAEGLKRT